MDVAALTRSLERTCANIHWREQHQAFAKVARAVCDTVAERVSRGLGAEPPILRATIDAVVRLARQRSGGLHAAFAVRMARYLTLELPGGTQLLGHAIQGLQNHIHVSTLRRVPGFAHMVVTVRQEPVWRRGELYCCCDVYEHTGARTHSTGSLPRLLRYAPVCT